MSHRRHATGDLASRLSPTTLIVVKTKKRAESVVDACADDVVCHSMGDGCRSWKDVETNEGVAKRSAVAPGESRNRHPHTAISGI